MNTEKFVGPAGLIEIVKDTSNPAARFEAAKWLIEAAGIGAGDHGEEGSVTRAARLAYGLDVPEIRPHVVEQFVFWMHYALEPMRAQAALELCRHIAGVMEANPTGWRAIIAEAVEAIGAYVATLEKPAAPLKR